MTRLLPDGDKLVRQIILGAMPAQQVGTQIPSDLTDNLPFVTARVFGGRPIDPLLGLDIRVDVQTWSDSRSAAADLAESCRVAFFDAWRNQTTYAAGRLSWQECIAIPTELPASNPEALPAQGLYRFQATYRLVVRPNN